MIFQFVPEKMVDCEMVVVRGEEIKGRKSLGQTRLRLTSI